MAKSIEHVHWPDAPDMWMPYAPAIKVKGGTTVYLAGVTAAPLLSSVSRFRQHTWPEIATMQSQGMGLDHILDYAPKFDVICAHYILHFLSRRLSTTRRICSCLLVSVISRPSLNPLFGSRRYTRYKPSSSWSAS